MTFSNYVYERPNIQLLEKEFTQLVQQFDSATDVEEQNITLQQINDLRNSFSTQENLAYIRSSLNTNDSFYEAERAYFDEVQPLFQQLETRFYKSLLNSTFRTHLEKQWGLQLFHLAENSIRTFSEEIVPLLQEENKIATEYAKLIASAQINYKGKMYTLAQLAPFLESTDRKVRKESTTAYFDFFTEHQQQLDEIYDKLVLLRHKIAVQLGFDNFVALGYLRMDRIGYDAKMVQNFRKQVEEKIVPIATELYRKQAERIGVDKLFYYDEPLRFLSGNAVPKGDSQWILDNGKKMYEQLSPETHTFINFMMEEDLLDVEAKKGKESGGYCTFIENYKAPFIFSNFNGTSGDIDVLTHEAGHAFQVYRSKDIGIPEYVWPTMEAAEIHSMSMEFFTWRWMELFFKEDAQKYQFTHLTDALLFLPYGVAVDEFQEVIYSNPHFTPTQRHAVWKEIEEKYLPSRNYDGLPYLENGAVWQKQSHIYEVPFYYIDYALAQVCALQFWKKSLENFDAAWQDYIQLCNQGGAKSFLQLVTDAHLLSPFEDGCIDSVIKPIEQYLASIDDSQF